MFCDRLEDLELPAWLFREEQSSIAILCETLETVDDNFSRHFESEGRGFNSLRARSKLLEFLGTGQSQESP